MDTKKTVPLEHSGGVIPLAFTTGAQAYFEELVDPDGALEFEAGSVFSGEKKLTVRISIKLLRAAAFDAWPDMSAKEAAAILDEVGPKEAGKLLTRAWLLASGLSREDVEKAMRGESLAGNGEGGASKGKPRAQPKVDAKGASTS